MTVAENIVYSYEPDGEPAIHYHAIPSACTGAADTLSEARSAYRSELAAVLDVQRSELPPVVEHVEAVVGGMWVRTRIGAVYRDFRADRMLLQTLLAQGPAQEEVRAHVDAAACLGAEPVVVLVERDDTVGTVLDQMTPRDAVVVTYSDEVDDVGWAAIYGPEAQGLHDIPCSPADRELRHTPIGDFANRFGGPASRRAVRLRGGVLRQAC
jgi:hypothetical protein